MVYINVIKFVVQLCDIHTQQQMFWSQCPDVSDIGRISMLIDCRNTLCVQFTETCDSKVYWSGLILHWPNLPILYVESEKNTHTHTHTDSLWEP